MHRKLMRAPQRFLLRLSGIWKRRFGVMPLRDSIEDMSEWFETPLGQALIQEEKRLVNESLNCLFGYHLMQLGISGRIDMGEGIRISHRFLLHPRRDEHPKLSGLTDFNHLPLASDSIDAVILHHTLDYTQSPHHLLREAARVIIPRGHLVIIGFNPWSLWGLGSWVARLFSSQARWRYQYLRLGRLLDWLSLVNLEPVEIYQGYYRPPLAQPNAIQHLQWMESWGKRWRLPWGGFYMIVARKDHLAMTPIKPAWQAPLPLRGLAVPRLLGQGGRPQSAHPPRHVHSPENKKTAVEDRRNIH
ncbi:methyltransferase domain-containing protein [Cellvibrio japonicus]|uniref:Generic methyl-transferase n=1 Tax=Cellvibrio japonicus (strain Ueda107) TaxID=498211 RepID=B3PHP9_CELJU|nr:methyltransferase domain-containing protein [Cellvibrio japonicus]ACE84663.1 Generic methyl-transferase [Cellvibrio japonicus Ueda107]QEI12517.1 methyltransferase domain-containing protein [Cellvibrio japonicus]QEI16091.1 methyltransferase domain-containing protein [Cellvibrio japonicus]QEI19669.1 methyltransferase domain-containing protein [Cellvibrio japonicus]